MKSERHKFNPVGSDSIVSAYSVSVSEYTSPSSKGFMVQLGTYDCTLTFHNVSAEDLRKLAFMFNAMAENAERTNNPA